VPDELLDVEPYEVVGDRRRIDGDDAEADLHRSLGFQARHSLARRPLADPRDLIHREARDHDRCGQSSARVGEDRVRQHEALDRGGLERGLEHRDPASHRVPDEHDRTASRYLPHEAGHERPLVRQAASAAVAARPAEPAQVQRQDTPVLGEPGTHQEP
jgi:hypothetical protein